MENFDDVLGVVIERFPRLGVRDAYGLWDEWVAQDAASDFEFGECCFLTVDDGAPDVRGAWGWQRDGRRSG